MKYYLFLEIIIAILLVKKTQNLSEDEKLFNIFIKKYNRTYINKEEYNFRFEIFKKNLEKIEQLKKKVTHQVGITKFSDRTDDEIKSELTSIKTDKFKKLFKPNKAKRKIMQIPDSYDSRAEGLVSPILNQKTCGACFAFSSIASLEITMRKKFGVKEILSPQQIVDCLDDMSCSSGASYFEVLEYFQNNPYIYRLEQYPYRNEKNKDKCVKNSNEAVKIKIDDMGMFFCDSFEVMKEAVYNEGSLMVSIAFKDSGLTNYKGGILKEAPNCNENSLSDHAVTIVGYGKEEGIDYWIVRNSMGEEFGEKGYFRIKAGVNLCNIEGEGYYFKVTEVEAPKKNGAYRIIINKIIFLMLLFLR